MVLLMVSPPVIVSPESLTMPEVHAEPLWSWSLPSVVFQMAMPAAGLERASRSAVVRLLSRMPAWVVPLNCWRPVKVLAARVAPAAAGAALVQVVPLLVRTLPLLPGATVARVPFPLVAVTTPLVVRLATLTTPVDAMVR